MASGSSLRNPMRVSQYFKLGREQPALDFVDVDVTNDLKAFIDPWALRHVESDWAETCVSLVQNYFQVLLSCAQANDEKRAVSILRPLREPNETHLGLSQGKSMGRALGPYLVDVVWARLKASRAVATGLLEDIEDTMLLIDNIGPDIVSDITSNIIRGPLIQYTQQMCANVGIPTTKDLTSGPVWSQQKQQWQQGYVELPEANGKRLILVPKIIVRRRLEYDVEEYYNDYIIEQLQDEELASPASELVHLIKHPRPGRPNRRVYKKDVKEKYGRGKAMILEQTIQHPDVLAEYRDDKAAVGSKPVTHEEVAATLDRPVPNWEALLKAVLDVPTGNASATTYEKVVEALFTAVFYPWLIHPVVQHNIHGGLKRIDITYSNTGTGTFFGWLAKHHPSSKLMIECKNYGADVGNPELDQLSSRFSPNRGQVGLLVCRKFDDKKRFLKRCRATADDSRGFVIALDDDDLKLLVKQAKAGQEAGDFPIFRAKFDELVM